MYCPKKVVEQQANCEEHMNLLLQLLYEAKRISSVIADKALVQFRSLCEMASSDVWKEDFLAFKKETDRLDDFYFRHVGSISEYESIWSVMKIILILSHGNASVESGFSINGDLLVENLKEESVVAQRQAYDGISVSGSVLNVNIDTRLIQLARTARRRYREVLDAKRAELKKDDDVRNAQKERLML
jgi:hypothetical protein